MHHIDMTDLIQVLDREEDNALASWLARLLRLRAAGRRISIVVDNDCLWAYDADGDYEEGEEELAKELEHGISDDSPSLVLMDLLCLLGIPAEAP